VACEIPSVVLAFLLMLNGSLPARYWLSIWLSWRLYCSRFILLKCLTESGGAHS